MSSNDRGSAALSSAYPSQPEASRQAATLPDVLDRILDKGLVIAGDVTLQLLDVEILTVKVRLLLASAERAEQMGIDWWKHDPFLSGQGQREQEDRKLQERIEKLESLLASVSESPYSGRDRAAPGRDDGGGQDEDDRAGAGPSGQ